MKTRVLSLLLACVLGLSLCACSGGGQMETSIAEDLFTQTIDKEDRSVQESDKIVITDQLGRTIEFDEPPEAGYNNHAIPLYLLRCNGE